MATLGVRILTIASISFNPTSVEGGVKANGLLTLTDVAPLGGMTVTLSSDKANVSVPPSVVVPAGKSSVAFVASTSVTGSSYDATITGTANGETGSGTLKVLAPAVSSFTLSSTSVKGGDKPLGTVKIAKASTVDVVVNLSSSNCCRCFITSDSYHSKRTASRNIPDNDNEANIFYLCHSFCNYRRIG